VLLNLPAKTENPGKNLLILTGFCWNVQTIETLANLSIYHPEQSEGSVFKYCSSRSFALLRMTG
jgi:hypothetical protein